MTAHRVDWSTIPRRKRSTYRRQLATITAQLEQLQAVTDAALTGRATRLAEQVRSATDPLLAAYDPAVITEAVALAADAVRRTQHLTPYPEQLLAAIAIADGTVIEMGTGEGKTIAAVLAAAWAATTGAGVHVATANPYLAERDATHNARTYALLGHRVAHAADTHSRDERRAAYAADITYSTVTRLGFDYLEDHLARSSSETVQRGLRICIVDEADALMIDDARTPLIISGAATAERGTVSRAQIAAAVAALEDDIDYTRDPATRQVWLTDTGLDHVEARLGLDDLHADHALVHHTQAALAAKVTFALDRDYTIVDGNIVLIDAGTGRLQPSRRLQDGLHEALEAKHGLTVHEPAPTVARISVQAFLGLYDHLAGMSGTAATDSEEFETIYDCPVIPIPPHRPRIRDDQPDRIFPSRDRKLDALTDHIVDLVEHGRPVLVGAPTVEDSEQISALLAEAGIDHSVLNAKHHAAEAAIIAQAGRTGTVTVATNMAGRGVDIRLGGDPVELARAELGLGIGDDPETVDPALVERHRIDCDTDRARVLDAGGLAVVATARADSRRIDDQLRGRAGRQGEPGSAVFYLSLEDDLVRSFGADRVGGLLATLDPDQAGLSSKYMAKTVTAAQRRAEAAAFEARKNILTYDDVYETQRDHLYRWREQLLERDWADLVASWATAAYRAALRDALGGTRPADAAPDTVRAALAGIAPTELPDTVTSAATVDDAAEAAAAALVAHVDARHADLLEQAPATLDRVVRMLFVDLLDQAWAAQLDDLDHLRVGIGLRRIAQRDPAVEFKTEALDAFETLIARLYRRGTEVAVGFQLTMRPKAPATDASGTTDADRPSDAAADDEGAA